MSIVIGNLYPGGSVVMGLTGADNGLSVAAGNAELGGTVTKNTVVALAAGITLNIGLIVASFKAAVANQVIDVISYVPPGDGLYRFTCNGVVNTIVAGSLAGDLLYVDQGGNAISIAYPGFNYLAVGSSPLAAVSIYAKAGSTIILRVSATVDVIAHVIATLEVIL